MANYLLPNSAVELTIAASDRLATWSVAPYVVDQSLGYPNLPDTVANVFSGTGLNTTAVFTAEATVTIRAGDAGLYYETGTGPVIPERLGLARVQANPGALNVTGTLTAALIQGGIVTSGTAAAVAATLDTGAVMAGVTNMAIGEAFEWSAINTGAANAFTVTASVGHTIVGAGAVAASSSGRFLTRRTAAATFVTYRLA